MAAALVTATPAGATDLSRPGGIRSLPHDAPASALPEALCNDCPNAQPLPDPTTTCQLVAGATSATCPSDFYALALTLDTTFRFTLCSAACTGAGASYDTRLRLRDAATCGILADNDDYCGLASSLIYRPPADGTYILEVTGFSTASTGSYTLGYYAVPDTCGRCAAPRRSLAPDATCRSVTDSNAACQCSGTALSDACGIWYDVPLLGGHSYTFSTCPNLPGACTGTAAFDTNLSLWLPGCTAVVASSEDASGCSLIFRSALTYTPSFSGNYKLQVRGFSSDNGTYTLAYQETTGPCTASRIAATGPSSGSASATTCAVTQAFTVDIDPGGTPPHEVTWAIAPPAGGLASPASGTFTAMGDSATFTSTLAGSRCAASDFGISVTVTNCAGVPVTRNWTYRLADTTPPRFRTCARSFLTDCATPDPPPPSPSVADNCDPSPVVVFSETSIMGPCVADRSTRREWTATDCNGNSSRCLQHIVHRDTTPPTLTGTDAWCLYPPSHEYYCISTRELALTTSDDCSGPGSVVLTGCTSSEPDTGTAPDDWPDDCIISPDGHEVCLRAERAGSVVDRTYAITGLAVDACGLRSAPRVVAIVTVPADDAADHSACRASDSGLDHHY